VSGEPDPAPTFAAAVALFNSGRYLAAHELFDELWEATHGEDSDFYKGLIQAAVALHHLEQGNLDGAAKLYGGHRRHLARYLPAHRGIDLAAFLHEMQRALGRRVEPPGAERPEAGGERPQLRPAR